MEYALLLSFVVAVASGALVAVGPADAGSLHNSFEAVQQHVP